MINRLRLFAAAFAVVLMSFGSTCVAAPASDSASDPAYAAEAGGAWTGQYNAGDPWEAGQNPAGNDNGGFGFQTWKFNDGYNDNGSFAPYGRLNHFIDGVDFPTTAFNDLGAPAFALGDVPLQYGQASATRPFSATLAIGEIFSADIDTPAAYEALAATDSRSPLSGF
jgi:hypothetical protein